METNCTIHWIVIVDSAVHLFNNWDLLFSLTINIVFIFTMYIILCLFTFRKAIKCQTHKVI